MDVQTENQIGGQTREEHEVSGDKVLGKIRESVHQGT